MIELGKVVRDNVTGFVGVATGRTQYLTGCDRYCVEPKVVLGNAKSDNECRWIDIDRLELV